MTARRLSRSLRRQLWFAALLIAVFFGFGLWPRALEWRFGVPQPELLNGITTVRGAGLILIALFYGLARPLAHPVVNARYAQFLMASPWTSDRPLPLGPAHLRASDAVLGSVLIGLAAYNGAPHPLLLPAVSAAAYGAIALWPLGTTGQARHAVAVAVLLALALRLLPGGWPFCAAAIAAGVVADHGLRRSLAAFPWPHLYERAQPKPNLGSTLAHIGPIDPGQAYTARQIIAATAIFAVWSYAILAHFWHNAAPDARPPLAMLLGVFGAACVGVRWLIYRAGYGAPVTLLGRIVRGPLFLPRFSVVNAAPLVLLVLAVVAAGTVHAIATLVSDRPAPVSELPPATAALAASVLLAISLAAPPSLRAWRLTGCHRIIAFRRNNAARTA